MPASPVEQHEAIPFNTAGGDDGRLHATHAVIGRASSQMEAL
jgi:hypothetical protein